MPARLVRHRWPHNVSNGRHRANCPGNSRKHCANSIWWVEGEPLTGNPLTGGVSSDIWRIDTARGTVCAKRALPKLRVAADWRAPIERNRYEARWMQVAAEAVAGQRAARARPARCARRAGDGVPRPARPRACGSSALRDGEVDAGRSRARSATMLARIHAPRRRAARTCRAVRHRRDLLRHPARAVSARHRRQASRPGAGLACAGRADAIAQGLAGARRRQPEEHPDRCRTAPVLLDAECAW